MSRLLEKYRNNIQTDLKSELKLKNIHEVPKIRKIVLNMGIGEAKDDSKLVDKALEDLSLISGQTFLWYSIYSEIRLGSFIKSKAKQMRLFFFINVGF